MTEFEVPKTKKRSIWGYIRHLFSYTDDEDFLIIETLLIHGTVIGGTLYIDIRFAVVLPFYIIFNLIVVDHSEYVRNRDGAKCFKDGTRTIVWPALILNKPFLFLFRSINEYSCSVEKYNKEVMKRYDEIIEEAKKVSK